MISERKLREWRRIALTAKDVICPDQTQVFTRCILELTQELLDQNLIERSKIKNESKT